METVLSKLARDSVFAETAPSLPTGTTAARNCQPELSLQKGFKIFAFSKAQSPIWLKPQHNRELLCLGRSWYPCTVPLTQQCPQYPKPSPGFGANPSFSPWHVLSSQERLQLNFVFVSECPPCLQS